MTTEIKTWEILDGKLHPVASTLSHEGRTERFDLEEWIATDPSIVRPDLTVIGRQVTTRSGPLDFLAIDKTGDLIVIELKRDQLPREALTQAIDYASDVASWSIDKIGEVCVKHTGKSLEDVLTEAFPDVDLEGININESQRIVLVGFLIESALERMIEWLSESYGVAINALVLKYVKTRNGSEIITRTAVVSEQIEEERIKQKKFTIPMSDEPATYENAELKRLLRDYLTQELVTARRIREVLIPACLERGKMTREQLKEEFVRRNVVSDLPKAGRVLTVLSVQMGMQKNGFLRQVIGYEYPNYPWEKDNYFIRPEYTELLRELLRELGSAEVPVAGSIPIPQR